MKVNHTVSRRNFIKRAAVGTASAAFVHSLGSPEKGVAAVGQQLPLNIGIRAASMKMVGDFDVIKTARKIPDILGVELQFAHGEPSLRDLDAVRRYKQEAFKWGMIIPSLAGIWDRGFSIGSPTAGFDLVQAIRAAEMLGSSHLLLAFFRQNAPDMSDEKSYGPLVAMLQKLAPMAKDAGVTLGLENSLSPADNKILVDLVNHSAVGVYYDLFNMEFHGHPGKSVPGIKLLGKERISVIHVKNGVERSDMMIEDKKGIVDWEAACREINDIGYAGWFVYETSHESVEKCIEETPRNNAFLRKHIKRPMG